MKEGKTMYALSMSDFAKDIKSNIQIFGPASLTEEGKVMPFEEQMAIITHYISTRDNGHARTYEIPAKELIKDVLDFKFGPKKEFENVAESPLEYNLFSELEDVPFKTPANPKFTFIDLFAGIGGFRIAMQNLGGQCIYSSEFDSQAQLTYLKNFGDMPFGDITKEETKKYIPDNFDVLCAGFPCQAFSLAGKRRGFEETRGTLFFDVAEILRRKQPKGIFLENVKGLKIHDHGRTFETIKNALDEVGYVIADDPQIVNAMNFGVPQHRERVYIIGVRKDIAKQYKITKETVQNSYPAPTDKTKRFIDIREEKEVCVKYYLSTQYIDTLEKHKARHAAKGNGFGYEIIKDDQVANAIVVGGMGRERNLVIDNRLTNFTPVTRIKGEVNRKGIRRMTPREWARLQGFPDSFLIKVADASAYKQFGNSVAVPAIQATSQRLLKLLHI